MKLVKLYSNNSEFHNIKFAENELNVVLGKITNKTILDKDTHNLGKTLLGSLIDFLLLRKKTNDFFLFDNEVFQSFIFYLEIHLDDDSYLLIRRSVMDATKISFRKAALVLDSFNTNINNWDYENLSFTKAVNQLQDYLGFDVVPDCSYRKSLNYFLRQQADYNEVFHLSKFKGSDYDWKKLLFKLLGYDDSLIQAKKNIDDKIEEKNAEIEFLQNRTGVNNDSTSIADLIALKNAELEEKQKLVDAMDFSKEDSAEHRNLVDKIDTQLQIANTEYYKLERDIDRISNSLKAQIAQIDLNNMREIFEESRILFPNEVYIQFENLIDFNTKLSTERNHYLQEQLKEMQDKLPVVKGNILDLQKQRQEALAFLTETNSYDKYKEIQSRISDLNMQVSSLKASYEQVSGYKNDIQKLHLDIAELDKELINNKAETSIMLQNAKHAPIRNCFNQIILDILNVNGIISLDINKNGNIEYIAKIQNSKTLELTSKGNGNSYRKLLCIAFDLALLINYHDKKYYKFVYHDGALEGLDDRKKFAFIKESRDICTKYGIQQIITVIDSDLPLNSDGSVFEFQNKEICLILSDKNPSQKLFGIEF